MVSSYPFILSAILAIANAKPVPNAPTKVARQTSAEPSSYPLGGACGNEWKYLNFNKDDATDKSRLQKLHDIICVGEMRALSAWGANAAGKGNEVYKTFFPLSDDEDDTQANVEEVLRKISGQSSAEGMVGKIVGSFVVDNKDFGVDTGNTCSNEGTLAYTDIDPSDNREKIHFCPIAYNRGTTIIDVSCSKLDNYASTKMDTFSRIALHEMLHYKTMGVDSGVGAQIVDVNNADGASAYDPERCFGLVDEDQDDNPGAAEINADSYAWMALDAWVSYNCIAEDKKEEYDEFFELEPPEYGD
ncbi:uncharacterized protein RHO25_010921 [Cercospora beticola]|uniref:Lysine-specific metallo-endopeptidase domain-containing protein n=1 Tax=Cercospora beticola TaxID=122368 RepID=A0ABZ0P328_CERBT|nr:hypothetical protein RHO25_010921 [Cercospora beticola]